MFETIFQNTSNGGYIPNDSYEEYTLVAELNDTQAAYPKEKSLVDLFEEQVIKSPEATAIVFEGKQLSYAELNKRSNRLANYLQKQGVKAETLVPICLERSLEMMVGILGILKAGGAYVPIDPEYPADRISYMLEDTGAKLILSSKTSKEKLNNPARIIALDTDWNEIAKEADSNPQAAITPNQLAYVIYTSGSTGKPKGVMNEHGGVVNRLSWAQDYFKLSSQDTVLQKTTFCFDVSVWELLWPLQVGAKLVFASPGGQSDSTYLRTIIDKEKITMLHFVPSMLGAFLSDLEAGDCKGLKQVLCSGEALSPSQVKLFAEKLPQAALHNLYGPTEAAIDVTYWSYTKGEAVNIIPIGKPVWNTQIYIVSKEGQLTPFGLPGEICIGGVQVARGYLNRAELTAEKFISDPFSKAAGARLYKTGDLGRWLPDGNVEYLGRIDNQVKIRGFRIELGEIENVMNELDLVQSSCLVVKREDDVPDRLVSYFVPNADAVKVMEHQLYSLQVNGWRELYEDEYKQSDELKIKDPEFNIITWDDSFTHKPIPEEQMREWQQDIVDVILAEKPENVLEIGCGSGLIFYPLAGKLKKYIGTDFSKRSIASINKRIVKGLRDYGVAEWQVSAAHEIAIAPEERLDTIIINSVVQYFPGSDYLSSVIENSIGLLKGQGRIIIGDIRDKRTLEFFKARLHLSNAQGAEDIKEFKWAVEQEVIEEEELCFAPEYFYNLQQLYPEITHIAVQWKNSSYLNELSLYRYTVIIYVGIQKQVLNPSWENWSRENATLISAQLKQGKATIAIKDALNPRLWQERQLSKAINESTLSTTSDILSAISKQDKESSEIEELLKEAKNKGYQSRFLLDEDPFKVNILLEQNPMGDFIKSVYSDKNTFSTRNYTNIPLFTEISKLMQKEIRSKLQQRLPDYMVPSEFVALRYFPLNSNGKIDRKFLSQRKSKITGNKFNYEAARNETEQTIVSIWQRLLNVDRVGIHDNFFELGGHSLIATRIVSSIRKELNKEINIKDLFIYPTIAELVSHSKTNNKNKFRYLVPIKTSGNKIPLYIICGSGGTVYKFREFVNLLDADQPVYGLQQFADNYDYDDFPDTIEGIASRYVDEILLQNPVGPYALSGHCIGGNIALEMAHQLEAAGKKVSLLAMFDVDAEEQNKVTRPSTTNIPAIIKKVLQSIKLKMQFQIFLITKHPKLALQYKIAKLKPLFDNRKPKPEEIEEYIFDQLTLKLDKAVNYYQMKFYNGEILLFNAKQTYYFVDAVNKIFYKELPVDYKARFAWKQYAKSVKMYEVDGEHSTIFEAVNAKEFSHNLQKHLNEITAKGQNIPN